jgi:GNAT superfamily N-acetyltransferase
MNLDQILALYDREQRRDIRYLDTRREETPDVVRHIALHEPDGAIIYAWLKPDTVEAVIREQIAYFEGVGHDFEWKVYSHDSPADLTERLASHGFVVEEADAIMVLDSETAPAALLRPVSLDVRRLTDPDHLNDVMVVQESVWQEDFSWLARRLARDLREQPEQLSVYVAYVAGVPASSAWIYFHLPGQFASLWGGSTLPAYRSRGLYSALLAVRVQEARHRGVRFLTVDASPMSRPILEKQGFQVISYAYPCKWHAKRPG